MRRPSLAPERPLRAQLLENPEGVDGAAVAGEGNDLKEGFVEAVDVFSRLERGPQLPAQDALPAADRRGRDAGER